MQNKINLLFSLLILSFSNLIGQQSFSLEQAISFAKENANEMKRKNIAVNDANQAIKEFRAIGIPKVNGTIGFQHYLAVPSQPVADFITPSVYNVLFDENVIPERDLGPPQTFKFTLFQPNTLSGGIEATAMLFDASYFYGVKGAKLYKELVSKDIDVSAIKIKTNVTKAYTAVLIAQENLNTLQKNIKNLSKTLNDTKALYGNGFAESLDVDRLQVSYDNLLTESERVVQLIEVSKNLLKFHMNYPLEQDIALSDDLNVIMTNEENFNTINPPTINFNDRPEYELLTLTQSLNELDYKRTKAGYYPTLRAVASAQASLQRKNLFDKDETGWIPQSLIGLNMSIPIYDGGEKSAKLQRLKLKSEVVNLDKLDFERAMTLEVNNALLLFDNASKVFNNRKKALATNQSIYDRTLIKFKEGVGSSVEVSQAESALYQAQANYISSIYDLVNAKTDIISALGK